MFWSWFANIIQIEFPIHLVSKVLEPNNIYIYILLGSKELGTNVLKLQCVILANHDQNV